MRDFYELQDNFKRYAHVPSTLVVEGKTDDPEYTIFIPTYKRAATLGVSVESAIKQFGDLKYEIIVINNDPEGTTGETPELLRNFGCDKLYYYVNSENIGMCGNWNRGIELARGKYICMIHDDDMLSPYFLKSMDKAIKENGNPGIIGVNSINFTSASMPEFTEPNTLTYRNVSKESFFFGKYITIAGMTVRRDLATKIGGYEDEYYPNEDTLFIYQGIVNDKVINIEASLAGYRQELNCSLNSETMKNIIITTEETRRNIAKYEDFAKKWMDTNDRVFLYDYVLAAKKFWNMEVDYKPVFEKFGFDLKEPSKLDIKMLHLKLKMMRKKYGI